MKKKQRFLFAQLMMIVMMAMSPMRAWAQEADPRMAVFNKLEGVTATFEDEGDYPWGLTEYIGLDALMSTNQDKDGTTSTTTIKLACDQAIELQFSYKTLSEAFADYLIISVDGNEVVNSSDAEPDEDGITTVVGNYASLLPANANGHTITMSYIKDISSSGGDDCGYIYFISAYTHQHYYNATSCDWSEDNTSATLHLECECGETADVEATTITTTEEAPTCVKDGFCTITASAVYNGKTVKDSKTETFAALGHDWQVQSDGTYACQREGCTAQSATFPIEVIESSGGFEGEGPEKLFDGDPTTKWCGSDVGNGSNSFYVIFKPSKPSVLVSYSLVDAEDTEEFNNRGWSSWDIQGTNYPNLEAWELISEEGGDYQGRTFTTGNTTAYTYYKITFSVDDSEDVDENGEYYLQQMADMNITWSCAHVWDNGICTACGQECEHHWEQVEGDFDFHHCTICESVGEHNWSSNGDGVCVECGYECQHGNYISIVSASVPDLEYSDYVHYSESYEVIPGIAFEAKCNKCGTKWTQEDTETARVIGIQDLQMDAPPTCTEEGCYSVMVDISFYIDEGEPILTLNYSNLSGSINSLGGHTPVTDEAVDATCTKSGRTEGSHCEVCGDVLVAQEEIPALGHTSVTDKAVDATCTESGLTEGSHCSVCDEVLVCQEEVPALGHAFGNKKTLCDDGYYHPVCTREECDVLSEDKYAKMFGDYKLVTSDENPTATIPMTKVGKYYYTSLYTDFPYTMSEDVEALEANDIQDDKIVFWFVDGTIAANNGVILRSETESKCTITYDAAGAYLEDRGERLLTGSETEVTEPAANQYAFGLSDTGYLGFWQWSGMKIPAWKAYLDLGSETATEARGFRIVFDDETNGIQQLPADASAIEGSYDLMGHKVREVKGLGIVNGKKVFVNY